MKESGRWRGEGESGREREKAYTLSYTRWWIAPWYRLSKWFRELKSSPQFGDYSVRRQHKTCSVFLWFGWRKKNRDRFGSFWLPFTHQNGLPQSVSQLALQARVRARAWRRGEVGDGDFPLAPIPTDREMEASVWCGNAAVMLLDTQQAAVTLLGLLPQRPSLDITGME